jgi:1-acyl-sn-glycerol-3-phosphate acyltransferase
MYALVNPYWSVHFEGRENIKKKQPYILISNHQSLADIMVLYGLFRNFKWVSKTQNFKIPFLGWVMRMNRYVEVDRMRGRSYIKMLNRCEEELRQGNSVLIFPEGTRSPDGNLHKFREGAFRLAVNLKIPIVPIVIDGTYEALPKKGFIFRKRAKIHVRVLQPVPPSSWGTDDPEELLKQMHRLIESELDKLKSLHKPK